MLRLGLVEFSWTFVFQLANTFVLYLVLKKFLFEPVTNMLQNRKKEIEESINEAENKNAEAETYRNDYLQKLQASENEGKNIIDNAVKKAEIKSVNIINAAKEEAGGLKERAAVDIQREKKKAINEIKNDISSIAILAASKVLEGEVNEERNKVLVSKFIDEVGEAKWQN